jgi:uncharacterized repeat protein (TIGR03803 family)
LVAHPQPVSAVDAVTYNEKLLFSFDGGDGAGPAASVIRLHGTLYGTTDNGGGAEAGSLFALDLKTGAEKVLASFVDNSSSSLLDIGGTLYGTTQGGNFGAGTVFDFDLSTGALTTIHTFGGEGDGGIPADGLIKVKGTLYGTTLGGGANNGGTVFALDLSTGAESVLYSFCSQANCADGMGPFASLINVNGTLYGTTASGAVPGCYENEGCGTVFVINRKTGKEKTLYSFCSQPNCADGGSPFASLILVNGILYGTTFVGGLTGCFSRCGTVFSIDPSTGTEMVLYAFCSQSNCADGAGPQASLIDVNGTLYGTTLNGGANGSGTVFSLDPSTGAETVLYSFCAQPNCIDGAIPRAALINVNGKFYGTTEGGGAYGYGTVFVLKQKS